MPRIFRSPLFILALLPLLLPAAFQAGPARAGQDTIVYSFMSNAGPLNPHLYSPNQMYAQEMLYEGLVDLGEDGSIVPALAESWEVSADGLEYRFRLRQGVRFSDGEPLDAEAVVKNFRAILANAGRHRWLPLVEHIEDFKAEGPLLFLLCLKAPYYPTLNDLALPRPFRLLSPAAFPEDGLTHKGIKKPVGSGPWKLAESRLGEHDLFTRNELHWGRAAQAGQVLVKVVPDPLSRAVALETGEIDLIYGLGQISYDTFNAFRANPAYATAISRPVGTLALAVNSAAGPTTELAVRLALQHALDRRAIVSGLYLGTQPEAPTLFSPDVPYCDLGLAPYALDPQKAAALLDEAGWLLPAGGKIRAKEGRPLSIDFCFVGNDASQKALAEAVQAQFARVGIHLNLLGEEEDSFFRRQREGRFGIIVNNTWGPPFEPHAVIGSMRHPSHADYMAQQGLPMKAELDAKITAVLATRGEAERRALYAEILTTLHEQAVYLPVCYFTLLEAHKKGRLEGVAFGPGRTKIPFENYRKR